MFFEFRTAKALAVINLRPHAVHWLTDVLSLPLFPNHPALLCGPSCQAEGVHTEELDNDLGRIFFSFSFQALFQTILNQKNILSLGQKQPLSHTHPCALEHQHSVISYKRDEG